jgi:DNA-binding CsgD family transcriptional regulator
MVKPSLSARDRAVIAAARNGITSSEAARSVGITRRRACQIASGVGVRFKPLHFWNGEELKELENLALTHSAEEIAEVLGRTISSVRNQVAYRRFPACWKKK